MATPEKWLVDWFRGGIDTHAGKSVDEESALTYSAVFACLRILSETVGSLPLHLYRRLPNGGKERAVEHPLYRILRTAPNNEMSPSRYKSTLQGHLASWGNAYSYIDFNDYSGAVTALWPLRPDRMKIERHNDLLNYSYLTDSGATLDIPAANMLHIPGFGFDGLMGYSPITLARESIGLALACEEFGARFFGAGTHPGAVVEHPGKLGSDAYDNLKGSLTKAHSGLGQSHRLLILEEGMKLAPIGIPPNDAQFLETRKYQLTEVARIFRVPPHMLADLERATFSNIEHSAIEFVVHTIRPWLVLWEEELTRRLLTEKEQGEYFIEFLVDGLLRGDIKSRYEAYSIGRQNGWLSANDIRERENMNPIEDGDIYLVPLNMIPANMVGQSFAPTNNDDSPAEPDDDERKLPEKRSAAMMIAGRDRVVASYRPIFEATAQRIVNKEGLAVKRQVEKVLKQRTKVADLSRWLGEFYEGLPDYIRKEFGPVFFGFSRAIQAEASMTIGAVEGLSEKMERFVQDYIDTYALRHKNSSLGQLRSLLEGEDLEALITRVDEWNERRAAKEARNETVRLNNAVAQQTFFENGNSAMWMTRDKSCGYCTQMEGRKVTAGQVFLAAGDLLTSDGVDMEISGTTAHPPLHQGCDCFVLPTL